MQKNHETYGQFEDGNQISFNAFNAYLSENLPEISFFTTIVPRMKELAKMSVKSVKHKLCSESNKFVFEIFGYDYILDEKGGTWLIEINTNPCIEESSELLKMLLPRMLGKEKMKLK